MSEPIRIRIAEIIYQSGCDTPKKVSAVPYRVEDSVSISKEALEKYNTYSRQELAGVPSQPQGGQDKQREKSHQEDPATKRSLGTLDLGPGARPEEIRKAYLEAVKKYHPDKFSNLSVEQIKAVEDKIKQINSAYSILKKA